MASTLLVVEDDPAILRGLQLNLSLEGFRVLVARDGEEALRFFQQHRPDLIVLDLMLPKRSGIEVIREVRTEDPATPILVLSARDGEPDVVHALALGADDYVKKPFSLAELIARIRARLRRQRSGGEVAGRLSAGPIAMDVVARRVELRGRALVTTAREFDLLRVFLEHPSVVFSREQLMRMVWGPNHYGTLRTVDNFVARLRAKVEEAGQSPRLETVRGVGYRFNAPEG